MIDDELQDLRKPVFFDQKGRRGRFFYFSSITLFVGASIMLALFVVSVLINPFLPQIRLKPISVLPAQPETPFRGLELPNLTKPDPVLKQTSDKAKLEQKKRD